MVDEAEAPGWILPASASPLEFLAEVIEHLPHPIFVKDRQFRYVLLNRALLEMGYVGVQLGTRFIATTECNSSPAYKQAILDATSRDIVLTERLTGVPVSVIRTPYVQRLGTSVSPLARWMFRGRKTKHWIRTWYALRSLRTLKRSSIAGANQDYWQAGKSVDAIHDIRSAADIVAEFAAALTEAPV